jgi:4-azaleucine resistance transporter AzlC
MPAPPLPFRRPCRHDPPVQFPDRPAAALPRFLEGWRAALPLWLGIIPFGLAFAVLSRSTGLGFLETQLLSAVVYAGGAQFGAVGLVAAGAGGAAIVVTTFLVNLRHLLYGLALGRRIELPGWRRVVAAFFLTDETFGIVMNSPRRDFAFLLGVQLSLYFAWNASTVVGSLAVGLVPDPGALGIDLVFPLSFVALLLPSLRQRVDWLVAVIAGLSALLLSRAFPGGFAILVASVLAAAIGAALTRDPEAA